MPNKKIILSTVTGAMAALAAPVHALTVGEAKVLSYTDQPLRVLIPVKAQGWEWKAIWATVQTYQHGLGLSAMLYKPAGEKTDGFIEIKSKVAITEPIVDLQITFDTGHRTTVHRTPILIDVQQSSSVMQQEAPPTAPASVTKSLVDNISLEQTETIESLRPVEPSSVKASEYREPSAFAPQSLRASENIGAQVKIPPSLTSAARQDPGPSQLTTYNVQRGDGLYAIASKFKPALWSHEEAMQRIYETNRHAFSGSKYNTLKAGATLTLDFGPSIINRSFENTVVEETPEPKYQYQTSSAKSTSSAPGAKTHSEFTQDDLLAAVQRHRMSKLQMELQRLQGVAKKNK